MVTNLADDKREEIILDWCPNYSDAGRRTMLAELDRVDQLRVLLADEDQALDLIGCAMEDALGYTREEWDFLRHHNPAFLRSRAAYKAARAVLAALREVVSG